MKVYAYIRNGKNQFVQEQIEAVVAHGYDFLEFNMNSAKGDKKILEQIVEKMAAEDVLLVQNLACFGLRSKKLYEFLTTLSSQSKYFKTLEEQLDSRQRNGEEFYSALKFVYNMERQVISENTTVAIGEARKEGVRVGRPKIDEDKIQEIRYLYKTQKISMRKISELVGASVGSVSKYVKDL